MNKILMLTTVALLGSTSLVAAQETTAVSAFSIDAEQVQESDGVINLGLVTSEADGVIEIYDIDDVNMEELLGSEQVLAGANSDVKITLTRASDSDVMAVLRVDGVVVATTEVDLDRDLDDEDNSGNDGSMDDGMDDGMDDNGGGEDTGDGQGNEDDDGTADGDNTDDDPSNDDPESEGEDAGEAAGDSSGG